MNVSARRLLDDLRTLAPAERDLGLRRALDAGQVQASDAAEIARDLRLPGWEGVDAQAFARVGARAHGGDAPSPAVGARPLPGNSPLFVRNGAPVGVAAKADAIAGMIGDERRGKELLGLITTCSPEELGALLPKVDCDRLFRTVKDHRLFGFIPEGRDYGTELARFVTAPENLRALSVDVRVALVDGMQKTDHDEVSSAHQRAITDIFVGTSGADLTALKNGIDLGDDQNNMHNLVYRTIDQEELRAELLAHIAAEGARTGLTGETKGLFDVDDTFYVSLKDDSYPHGTVYPGATAYHRELDLGPGGGDRLGDNTFLSARPHDHLGLDEKLTLQKVHAKGEGPAAVITGDLLHFVGNEAIAAKKIANYEEFAPLYPEYRKVFEGDSGQGDVLVAVELRAKHPDDVAAAFIHELPNHRTDPALKARAEQLGVVFFDTRVGQATAALGLGLISREGLGRVIDAAEADFAGVDFGAHADKQAARRAELDRDIAAARRALA